MQLQLKSKKIRNEKRDNNDLMILIMIDDFQDEVLVRKRFKEQWLLCCQ